MPAVTTHGLPYPLPSEPVRDGAQAIKNLADALDARGVGYRIIGGGLNAAPDAAGRFSFTWPGGPFGAQPWVAVTPGSSETEGMIAVAIRAPLMIDAAGFNGVAMNLVPNAPTGIRTTPFFMTYVAIGVYA